MREGGIERKMKEEKNDEIHLVLQVMDPIKQTTGLGLGMRQILTLLIKLGLQLEKIKNFLQT